MLFFKQCPVSYNTPYEKIGDEVRSLADEVPFDIPDSWEWVRLSQIALVLNGDRGKNYPSKEKLVSSGIPFISALNLDGNTVINDANLLCVTEEQYNLLANGKLEKGDIVVCIRGSLGKHAKYPFEKGAIASSLVILRALCGDEALSDYIMMWLDSPAFFSEIRKYDNGTAQPNLAAKSLEQFFVPIPPISEQKRILEKLDKLGSSLLSYDAAHSKSHLLAATFPEALKKSILQEAVQGKLVPQDPTDEPAEALLERIRVEKQRLIKEGKIKKDKHESVIFRRDNSHYEKLNGVERCIDDELPFEIPPQWCWIRFESTITLLSGTDFAPDEYNSAGKGIAYITGASNIVDSQILVNRWTETPRQIAHAGDVLLVCKGSGYGKTVICNIAQAHIARQIMAVQKSDLLDMQYVKLFLDSSFDLLKAKGQGVIPGIDRTSVLHLLFPLPPLAEQHRIVQRIEELLPLVKGL